MAESRQTLEATVRRVPRYGVFMMLGAVLGVIVAGILAMAGGGEASVVGVTYSPGQVFGFLLLYAVPIGVALGALFAMLLERLQRRHDRVVHVDRKTVGENGNENENESDDDSAGRASGELADDRSDG